MLLRKATYTKPSIIIAKVSLIESFWLHIKLTKEGIHCQHHLRSSVFYDTIGATCLPMYIQTPFCLDNIVFLSATLKPFLILDCPIFKLVLAAVMT